MSDELKSINLSKEKGDTKQQTLRSPLAQQTERDLAPRPKRKGFFAEKDDDKIIPPSGNVAAKGEDDNFSSVHNLKFREEERRGISPLIIWIIVLTLPIAIFVALSLISSNLKKKGQTYAQIQFYKIQENGLSLLDIFEGKNVGFLNKFRTDQQAKLRGLMAQQIMVGGETALPEIDCTSNPGEKSAGDKNRVVNKLATIDCYLFADLPIKAFYFGDMSAKNSPTLNQNGDNFIDSILDIQVKYRLWYPSSAFKGIRFNCNRWEPKPECALRVVLDGYYKSALTPERGFQIVKDLQKMPSSIKVYLWLAGGRIAMFDGRYTIAEDRLLEADKLAPPNAPGLAREIMESRVLNAYSGHNKTLLKQVVDKFRMVSPSMQKDVLGRVEFMQSVVTAKEINQRRSIIIKFLAQGGRNEKVLLEPWFFNVLGFEANINGVQDPFISYLARIKQTFGTQKDISRHINILVDQWTIRTHFAAKQYQNVKNSLINYKKEYGNDSFYMHFLLALQIKTQSAAHGVMQLTGDIQQALAQKDKLPWQTQHLLGESLLKSGKLAEMPSLLGSYEHGATLLDAKCSLFLLKVEYLIAQQKFDLALKNLDLFSTNYPDSLQALIIRQALLPKTNADTTAIADVKKKIELLQNSEKYRDNLRLDPFGPFAIMDQ